MGMFISMLQILILAIFQLIYMFIMKKFIFKSL